MGSVTSTHETLARYPGLGPEDRERRRGGDPVPSRLDASFKSRRSIEHRLVLELLFVERIPAEDLADALEVSVTMLKSFVLAVFEDLAGLSHLEHAASCPPDVTLALDVLSRMDRTD